MEKSPRCHICKRKIKGDLIKTKTHFYHPDHFYCSNCHKSLSPRSYFEVEEPLKCKKCLTDPLQEYILNSNEQPKTNNNNNNHHHNNLTLNQTTISRRSICPGCNLPVDTNKNYLTVKGRDWHPEHFVCVICQNILTSGEKYYSHQGRPYCVKDYFLTIVCQCGCGCGQTPQNQHALYGAGRTWIPDHFRCFVCKKKFSERDKFYQVTSIFSSGSSISSLSSSPPSSSPSSPSTSPLGSPKISPPSSPTSSLTDSSTPSLFSSNSVPNRYPLFQTYANKTKNVSNTSLSTTTILTTSSSSMYGSEPVLLNFCSQKHFFEYFPQDQTLPRPYVVKKRISSASSSGTFSGSHSSTVSLINDSDEQQVPSIQHEKFSVPQYPQYHQLNSAQKYQQSNHSNPQLTSSAEQLLKNSNDQKKQRPIHRSESVGDGPPSPLPHSSSSAVVRLSPRGPKASTVSPKRAENSQGSKFFGLTAFSRSRSDHDKERSSSVIDEPSISFPSLSRQPKKKLNKSPTNPTIGSDNHISSSGSDHSPSFLPTVKHRRSTVSESSEDFSQDHQQIPSRLGSHSTDFQHNNYFSSPSFVSSSSSSCTSSSSPTPSTTQEKGVFSLKINLSNLKDVIPSVRSPRGRLNSPHSACTSPTSSPRLSSRQSFSGSLLLSRLSAAPLSPSSSPNVSSPNSSSPSATSSATSSPSVHPSNSSVYDNSQKLIFEWQQLEKKILSPSERPTWPNESTIDENEAFIKGDTNWHREIGSDKGSHSVPPSLLNSLRNIHPIYLSFSAKKHHNFFVDSESSPMVISIEQTPLRVDSFSEPKFRVILRTPKEDEFFFVSGSSTKERIKYLRNLDQRFKDIKILRIKSSSSKFIFPSLPLISSSSHNSTNFNGQSPRSSTRDLQPINLSNAGSTSPSSLVPSENGSSSHSSAGGAELVAELINFENKNSIVREYTIGILYCKENQENEEDMFNNEHGSKEFERFLETIGEKITLKGWNGYRNGLDTTTDTTGIYSYYTDFNGLELMFHVSTCLPYSIADKQKIERKRHLGNDVVVIIFKEGNQKYCPAVMRSHFNHVIVLVELISTDPVQYRVGVASKVGVTPHEPHLPNPPIFEPNEEFREFLLTKIIMAHSSAMSSPDFSHALRRTRKGALLNIISRFSKNTKTY